ASAPPMRHSTTLGFAELSPDGTQILTSGYGGGAQLWDSQTGAALGPEFRAAGPVQRACFGPDGRSVLIGSGNFNTRGGAVQVWNASTRQTVAGPIALRSAAVRVAFSPDGRLIAAADAQGAACVWESQTGRPTTHQLVHEHAILDLSFSPESRR